MPESDTKLAQSDQDCEGVSEDFGFFEEGLVLADEDTSLFDMSPLRKRPDSSEVETKRIKRPKGEFDTQRIRTFVAQVLFEGTEGADLERNEEDGKKKKKKKKHEIRYDFCIDPSLERYRHLGRYQDIIFPNVFDEISQISKSVLPRVIAHITKKYKLKEGDLQIDEEGRLTIPDKKIVKIKRRKIPFSSRTKRGKARSVLKLDEEIRSRYLAEARPSLRALAKKTAESLDIQPEIARMFSSRLLILGELRKANERTFYLARDINTNELVALKVVNFDRMAVVDDYDEAKNDKDNNIKVRYQREAMTVERLNHENVPGFIEADETECGGYLVIEWVDGMNLDEYMGEGGFLPLSMSSNDDGSVKRIGVMELGIQLGTVMHALHDDSPSIIHRDLKPSNIMVDKEGDIHLVDFGISCERESPGMLPGLLSHSPGYAAPETLMGDPFDESVDVYGIGSVLYRALTGYILFKDDGSTGRWIKKMKGELPKSPREMRPEVPEALSELVMRCLAKDSQERPTLIEFLEELMEIHADYVGAIDDSNFPSDHDIEEFYTSLGAFDLSDELLVDAA